MPIGIGPRYRPSAISAAVAHRTPIGSLRCTTTAARSFGVHLELYARARVIPVPAGIGIAPPQRRDGAYVRGGACGYPARTFEPTGVVIVTGGRPLTLAQLFVIWGQPLSRTRLLSFHGRVQTFVDGRRWTAPPGRVALSRHAEIVVEVGGYVIPHPAYLFGPGV